MFKISVMIFIFSIRDFGHPKFLKSWFGHPDPVMKILAKSLGKSTPMYNFTSAVTMPQILIIFSSWELIFLFFSIFDENAESLNLFWGKQNLGSLCPNRKVPSKVNIGPCTTPPPPPPPPPPTPPPPPPPSHHGQMSISLFFHIQVDPILICKNKGTNDHFLIFPDIGGKQMNVSINNISIIIIYNYNISIWWVMPSHRHSTCAGCGCDQLTGYSQLGFQISIAYNY